MLLISLRCHISLAIVLVARADAQSFIQARRWREPLINISYDDRLSLGGNTLDVLSRQIDFTDAATILTTTASGMLLYVMAEYDRRSNSSIYQVNMTSALGTLASGVVSNGSYFRFSSDRLRLGLAYFSAHLAYSDSPKQNDFLNAALALWDTSAALFVSQETAGLGNLSGIPAFNSTCKSPTGNVSVSVAGAISVQDGTAGVNGETIGSWIALSSLLYTSRQNSTYLELAGLSIRFSKTFLSNGAVFWDSFNFGICTLTNSTFTYNGGYFLKGLSKYYRANATAASPQDLEYLNELAASLILYPGWTSEPSGINIEDAITDATADLSQTDFKAYWKAILTDGLYECLAAGLLNETVANLTQQYISVQYNAVRELANYTALGNGISQQVYGPGWNGTTTPLKDYDALGELAASMLFVTALGIGPQPITTTTNSTPPTTASHTPSRQGSRTRTPISAIVGSVTGGIIAIAFFACVLHWCRRKRAASISLPKEDSQSSPTQLEPYFATTEQYPITERSLMFARADGGPGYLTKHEHIRDDAPAPSSVAESSTPSHSVSDQTQRDDDATVRIDASTLQRLLLNIGGTLSDLQRRRTRHEGDDPGTTSEPPPQYEQGPSGR